nr:hypothetical protein [uncultured Hyphomonas sp.]
MFTPLKSILKTAAIAVSFTTATASVASAQGMKAEPAYLNCRILASTQPDAVTFAGAMMIWSDENLSGITAVPGSERIYECSRELRARMCRTYGGPLTNPGEIEEYAMNGAFLGSMGEAGMVGGAVMGGAYGMVRNFYAAQMAAKSCYDEVDYLTTVTEEMTPDWSATFADSSQLNYGSYLILVDYAQKQNLIKPEDVDRMITFTDRMAALTGGQ